LAGIICSSVRADELQGAAADRHFNTKYTDIKYADEKLLTGFIWHLSGKKLSLPGEEAQAKAVVDRIVERVMSILDMRPRMFRAAVDLVPGYESGYKASYNKKTNSITVHTEVVTDGMFAHEVAHAVISAYFQDPPPRRTQEILTQYVDQHLWEDYY